jgi:long-chain acyl-CoA synthetase
LTEWGGYEKIALLAPWECCFDELGERAMLNLASFLEDNVRERPNKTAFIYNSFQLDFVTLNAMANQVANALVGLGVRKGDKVALMCPNIPFFPIVYFAILKVGAVAVPLNVLFRKREVIYHLTDSETKVFFAFEGTEQLPMGQVAYDGFKETPTCKDFIVLTAPGNPSPFPGVKTLMEVLNENPPIFDTVQTEPDDTCLIIYTSGTTGQPKGAELTNSNLVMNSLIGTRLLSLKDDDISLICLPLFHSFGLCAQMHTTVLNGGTCVLLPRFEAGAVLQAFQDHGVSVWCAVPTMYWDILNYPDLHRFDLEKIRSRIRICNSGGAAMPVELLRQFEAKFGVVILEGYGLSETSPTATFNRQDKPRKVGSIGLPIWGVEVRVVDEDMNDVRVGEPGEIVIRGHNIMKGYYKRPEANAECMRGGWFHTGDVGKIDEDGYFYVVDRTKDMIIRGGFNVYPRELEEVLMTHPDVSLAAVIGFPHEEYGEEIKAFIVPKASAKNLTVQTLYAWGKEQFAGYKYPRVYEIRSELPLGPTGKILKKELRKQELEKLEHEKQKTAAS